MSLLDRIFGRQPASLPAGTWEERSRPNDDYDDYLIELAATEGRALRWFTARLVVEPENPFDPGAIAVYSDAGKVGYLSRDHARDYRDVFARLERRAPTPSVQASNSRPLCLASTAPPSKRHGDLATRPHAGSR